MLSENDGYISRFFLYLYLNWDKIILRCFRLKVRYISRNYKDTYVIGYKLGKALGKRAIVCLIGELGAGKTSMAKGIAAGLDVRDEVTSPTFTIVNEYDGRLPLYHFDVYRISNPEEMYEIGFDEYIYGDGVCVIEWADLIEDIIPEEAIWVDIKYLNDDERIIEIIGPDDVLMHIIEGTDYTNESISD